MNLTSQSLTKIALIVGINSSVFAGTMGPMPLPFNGFYLGAMGGVNNTSAKMSSFSAFDTFTLEHYNTHLEKYTGIGAAYLGYIFHVSDRYTLAGEFFVNVAKRNNAFAHLRKDYYPGNIFALPTVDTLASVNAIRLRDWGFGLDARPGYILKNMDTMVYGRVGVEFNRITKTDLTTLELQSSNIDGPNVNFSSAFSTLYTQFSKYKAGLRLGGGVEHLITPNIAITADYIFTWYGNSPLRGRSVGNVNYTTFGEDIHHERPNALVNNNSARINTQALMLGAKYYF